MNEMYNEEYFRKIHRENAYILMQTICALSVELNISENSRELCNKLMDGL